MQKPNKCILFSLKCRPIDASYKIRFVQMYIEAKSIEPCLILTHKFALRYKREKGGGMQSRSIISLVTERRFVVMLANPIFVSINFSALWRKRRIRWHVIQNCWRKSVRQSMKENAVIYLNGIELPNNFIHIIGNDVLLCSIE